MRKLLVFVAAAVFSSGLSGQPAGDSAAVWWRASGNAVEMNFNPSMPLPDSVPLTFPVANTGAEADMIVVYSATDSVSDGGLWPLEDSMGARIGLTTQRILGEGGSTSATCRLESHCTARKQTRFYPVTPSPARSAMPRAG